MNFFYKWKKSEHFNNKNIKISIEKIAKRKIICQKKNHMIVSRGNDEQFTIKYKFIKNKVS